MGFLGFLFKGEKELKSLRESITNELGGIRQEIQKSHHAMKKENTQILSVLASFEKDMDMLKEDTDKKPKGAGKSDTALEKRLAAVEKISETITSIGRLSIQNHDTLRSMEAALKRLDAVEKTLKEHISLTPEVIISKDEYSEEISELKKRLDALESKELIVVGESKKKKK